jgi:hypothetical protein
MAATTRSSLPVTAQPMKFGRRLAAIRRVRMLLLVMFTEGTEKILMYLHVLTALTSVPCTPQRQRKKSV